jgi:hypothetical protein
MSILNKSQFELRKMTPQIKAITAIVENII